MSTSNQSLATANNRSLSRPLISAPTTTVQHLISLQSISKSIQSQNESVDLTVSPKPTKLTMVHAKYNDMKPNLRIHRCGIISLILAIIMSGITFYFLWECFDLSHDSDHDGISGLCDNEISNVEFGAVIFVIWTIILCYLLKLHLETLINKTPHLV